MKLADTHLMGAVARAAGAVALLGALACGTAFAEEEGGGLLPRYDGSERSVCALIELSARANRLPIGFFTKLIWRESAFRPAVVSFKGAQGIAQFMPGTAADRRLADPFDPNQAIPASAKLLHELRSDFGNLGLAAAAYNAGPDRVSRWLAGQSTLPAETEGYVLAITSRPARDWMGGKSAAEGEQTAPVDCLALVPSLRRPSSMVAADEGAYAPWGAQVAGNFSRDRALRSYSDLQRRFPQVLGGQAPMVKQAMMRSLGTRPMYQVRIPAQTREAANTICQKLSSAGGACVVFKN